MNNPSAHTLQHWMKSVLVSPGNLQQKLFFAGKDFLIDANEQVIGTELVSVETRLGIYTTGYMLRLLECMEADLPSLYAYLGEDLFVVFARAYLLEQPSQSYSLFELTRRFADYLDRTRPRDVEMDEYTNAKYDLLAELARIERARLEALRSKGTEGVLQTKLSDIFSFFSGKESLFLAHPCLQLLQLKMPLVDFYRKLVQNENPELPEPKETFAAMSRVNYHLKFLEILPWQFYMLTEIQVSKSAQTMSGLLHAVSLRSNQSMQHLLADASLWLPFAIEMGLIIEV